MLREGWDVRNVCVIVTLRPLTAANRILPEQALGRGLRRMTPPGSGFDERVVVIEHEAFRNLWSAELDGGLVVEKEEADKIEPRAVTIFPDEAKRRFDIVIPAAHPRPDPRRQPLSALHPADVPNPKTRLPLPDVTPDEYVQYRGVHLIDKGDHRGVRVPRPLRRGPLRRDHLLHPHVAKEAGVDRLAGAFATLAPMVRDYLKQRVFERPVDLDDKVILRRLAENDAQALVVGASAGDPGAVDHRARADDRGERPTRLQHPAVPVVRATVEGTRRSSTSPRRQLARGPLRAVPRQEGNRRHRVGKADHELRFALEYISKAGACATTTPTSSCGSTDDSCLIVETKGQEDLDVALKDRRARRWCEDATRLSGREWGYEKVPRSSSTSSTATPSTGCGGSSMPARRRSRPSRRRETAPSATYCHMDTIVARS